MFRDQGGIVTGSSRIKPFLTNKIRCAGFRLNHESLHLPAAGPPDVKASETFGQRPKVLSEVLEFIPVIITDHADKSGHLQPIAAEQSEVHLVPQRSPPFLDGVRKEAGNNCLPEWVLWGDSIQIVLARS